jgi:hypothetical protein
LQRKRFGPSSRNADADQKPNIDCLAGGDAVTVRDAVV